jgi:glycosyl transferase family 25
LGLYPSSGKTQTLAQRLGGKHQTVGGFHEVPILMEDDAGRSIHLPAYVHAEDPGRSSRVLRHLSLPASVVTKGASQAASHCFVISLKRAAARRRYVLETLLPAVAGLACDVVDAVDGLELSPDELNGAARPEDEHHHVCYWSPPAEFVFMCRPCTPGEVGCALSHARVLSRIVEAGIQWAVVLEDDVALPADFQQRVQQAVAAVPHAAEAPLVYLGHPPQMLQLADAGREAGCAPGLHLDPAQFVWTTYSYVVSLAAAERLVGGIAPVGKPIDHHFVLASASKAVDAFACRPQIVSLAPHFTESTVGGWS